MKVKQYRALCQKNELENYFFDKYVFRRISIYFTILFIKLHVQANQATFLSLLAALGSCYFLMFNTTPQMVTAAVLIFLYHMLDHVDGELARYYISKGLQKPSLSGQYFDVLIHKYSTNLMLFFLSISIYRAFNYPLIVLIGFAACIGMSAFPNLVASQVMVQRIANNKEIVYDSSASEILDLLEKKKKQIEKIKALNLKKILSELLFFPGALISIILVIIVDLLIYPIFLFNTQANFRLIFLLVVTPIYLANAIRQSMKWLNNFDKIS
jgi:phosphatidylglycerophosphate synthase